MSKQRATEDRRWDAYSDMTELQRTMWNALGLADFLNDRARRGIPEEGTWHGHTD